MPALTWLHHEDLNPQSPAWAAARQAHGLDTPAVVIFDRPRIERRGYTLKRVVFLYECAIETGAELYDGDPLDLLQKLLAQHHAEALYATRTADPRITAQGDRLGVAWVDPPAFVTLPGPADLKRFSRYWRKAERLAGRPTGQA
ncbi:MAG: hypothetical protein AAF288_07450 [Planctomycetota bacterium]